MACGIFIRGALVPIVAICGRTSSSQITSGSATGSSANTPSTLVKRNAFGNFSAGTITATSFISEDGELEVTGNKDQPNGYPGLDEDGHLVGPIIVRNETNDDLAGIVLEEGELAYETDTKTLKIGDGIASGGLPVAGGFVNADACIVVKRSGTNAECADNLRDAYALAKTLTPGGSALSATNRATVLIPPGKYDFVTGNVSNHGLVVDTEFVDLVGTSREGTILTSQIQTELRGTVEQTADNVAFANLTISIASASSLTDGAAYFPLTALSSTYCYNCKFLGDTNAPSMRWGISYAGTFVECETDYYYGFGAGPGSDASGSFIRCKGGVGAFGGGGGIASGEFTDCYANDFGFGGDTGGTATGTFTRCTLYGSEWGGTFSGSMDSCFWRVYGTNKTALMIDADANVLNSTIIGSGSGKSINAATSVSAVIAHCRLNKGIGVNVTNLIGTPYNVDDTDLFG